MTDLNLNLQNWHQAMDARDTDRLFHLIARDAVFHSPVVHSPQEGREIVYKYLSAAFMVLANDSFRYVREIMSGSEAVLEFECELDGITVNGVDMIRWNDEGLIQDFKVLVRPMKGMAVVREHMGRKLMEMG